MQESRQKSFPSGAYIHLPPSNGCLSCPPIHDATSTALDQATARFTAALHAAMHAAIRAIASLTPRHCPRRCPSPRPMMAPLIPSRQPSTNGVISKLYIPS